MTGRDMAKQGRSLSSDGTATSSKYGKCCIHGGGNSDVRRDAIWLRIRVDRKPSIENP